MNDLKLVDAARDVLANWERGDLAGAVRRLDAALQAVDALAPEPKIPQTEEGSSAPQEEPCKGK